MNQPWPRSPAGRRTLCGDEAVGDSLRAQPSRGRVSESLGARTDARHRFVHRVVGQLTAGPRVIAAPVCPVTRARNRNVASVASWARTDVRFRVLQRIVGELEAWSPGTSPAPPRRSWAVGCPDCSDERLEASGSRVFAVELSVGEYRPRQEAPPACNGRGTLGSSLTVRRSTSTRSSTPPGSSVFPNRGQQCLHDGIASDFLRALP